MSRSATYRPTHLSQEQREELVRQVHLARAHRDVLPLLREHVRHQAKGLALEGRLPASHRANLDRRLSEATSTESLRALALELAAYSGPETTESINATEVETSAGIITAHDAPRPLSVFGTPTAKPTLEFDLVYLRWELTSLRTTAEDLGLDLPGAESAADAIDAIEAVLSAGDPAVIAAAVTQARARLGDLNVLVDNALAAAEWRSRTTEAVLGTLRSMGYAVSDVSEETEGTVVAAARSDGRRARIEVIDVDDDDANGLAGLHAEFTDPSDTVPADHPQADEICHPAVADAVDFHQRLAAHSAGLGPIEAEARPTRGSALTSQSGTRRANRRTARSTSTTRTRRTP